MIEFSDLWRGHRIKRKRVRTPALRPITSSISRRHRSFRWASRYSHNQCAIRSWASPCAGPASRRHSSAVSRYCSVHPREDMHFINANQLANGHRPIEGIAEGIDPTEKFVGADAARSSIPRSSGARGIIYIQDYWRRSI